MTHLLAALLFAAAPPAIAVPDQGGRYSVILEVTADEAGAVQTVAVSRVIDPRKGSGAVAVEVDENWLAGAREHLMKRAPVPGKPRFYTYFSYTPGLPFQAL